MFSSAFSVFSFAFSRMTAAPQRQPIPDGLKQKINARTQRASGDFVRGASAYDGVDWLRLRL